MQVVILVLNKVELLENLLKRLALGGIKGGTIIESTGMARALGDSEDSVILGTLRMLLDPKREESKTLFFVVEDSKVKDLRDIVDEVLGGIDKPDTGILFGMPLSFVEGIGENSIKL